MVGFVTTYPWSPLAGATAAVVVLLVAQLLRPERDE
jgi:hypothetical protein